MTTATPTPTVASTYRTQTFLLGASRLISSSGTSLGRVALAFALLEREGLGGVSLSIVMVAQVIPQLVGALAGGFLADRWSRKGVIVTSDLIAAASWLALWWCLGSAQPSVTLLSILAAISGLATVTAGPALTGIVPDIVGDSARVLRRVNSVVRSMNSLGLTLGLAGAGIIAGLLGARMGVLVNAASFLVAAVIGMLLRPRRAAVPTGSRMVPMLREGYREFWSRPWIWVVVVQSSFYVAVSSAMVGVLGPITASREYAGAATWSQFMLAQAMGGILGAGAAGRVRVRYPIRMAVPTTLVGALTCLLLAATAPVFAVVAAFFVLGMALDLFGVLWETSLQSSLSPTILSRVASWDLFGSLLLAPVGLGLAGPLSESLGPSTTLYAGAATIVVTTVAALISRDVRDFTYPSDGARE